MGIESLDKQGGEELFAGTTPASIKGVDDRLLAMSEKMLEHWPDDDPTAAREVPFTLPAEGTAANRTSNLSNQRAHIIRTNSDKIGGRNSDGSYRVYPYGGS
ncbi:MAG TPA: hypothetical protein VG604_03310 [Candidatus Saccharimonadales bacterium]|nr:hypothetical protein [Candidatus Saccharimonadales bacterium]